MVGLLYVYPPERGDIGAKYEIPKSSHMTRAT